MNLTCDVCGATNLQKLSCRDGQQYCDECVPEDPGYPAHTCIVCGKREPNHYVKSVKVVLAEKRLCHTCHFWQGYVASKGDPMHAVVRGTHYVICPDEPGAYKPSLGFGGDRFLVRFHDGREVVTTNLWCQGDVPERFRADLPDNARFGERPSRPRFTGELERSVAGAQ